ncbi:MAG: alpha/beta fold hydrolase [Ilumatobacter sp.]
MHRPTSRARRAGGAVVTPPAFPPTGRGGAIVLVHGAWVGEWCWEPVLPLIRRSGRAVHAVSLRGHGVRARESGPHITLDDHVDDLVDLVDTFDLDEVTLVGHSYGGRVVTRAWPRVADRVDRLVYLDAHAPLGEAAIERATGHLVERDGMVPFDRFTPDPAEFGGADAVDWFTSRLRPQSAATLSADFAVDLPTDVDTTYVAATKDADSPFAGYAAAARAACDWRFGELDCSHWLMIARPVEVARIVLDPTTLPLTHPTSGDPR